MVNTASISGDGSASDAGESPKPAAALEPKSARGQRTRAVLIQAARVVFERDGFLDAKVSDIPLQAGIATGSFYTYFKDKREIFKALVEEIQEEMLYPDVRVPDRDSGIADAIAASNLTYLESYRANARLMALFEEMTLIDQEFLELRLARARTFSKRTAAMIRRLQHAGIANKQLDPELAASALSAMVSRMAQLVFVWGEQVDIYHLSRQITLIWTITLGLPAKAQPQPAPKR